MELGQYLKKIPEFKGAIWLIRMPIGIVFILQGLQKLPLNIEDADAFGLPMSVWFFVAWGELFARIGLLVGGVTIALKDGVGDFLTRFSGIVICGMMTGVILIAEPEHFHLMLYCGCLFFALRGNRVK